MANPEPQDDDPDLEPPDRDDPTELPDPPDDVRTHQGCPECDDPGDPEHNCLTVQKAIADEDENGDATLKLLLYLKCTCGHERRRVLG